MPTERADAVELQTLGEISPESWGILTAARARWLATGALLLLAWCPAVAVAWGQFGYPCLPDGPASSLDQFSHAVSHYNAAPVLALIAASWACVIYRRSGAPSDKSAWARVAGYCLLICGAAIHSVGVLCRSAFLIGVGLCAVVWGVVLVAGGWRLLGKYLDPLILLLVLVPKPWVWVQPISNALDRAACTLGATIAQWCSGTPWLMDDVYLYTPGASGTSPLKLEWLCTPHRGVVMACVVVWLILIARGASRRRAGVWVAATAAAVFTIIVLRTAAAVGLDLEPATAWFDPASLGALVLIVAAIAVGTPLHARRPPAVRAEASMSGPSAQPTLLALSVLLLLAAAVGPLQLRAAGTAGTLAATAQFESSAIVEVRGVPYRVRLYEPSDRVRDVLQTQSCALGELIDCDGRRFAQFAVIASDRARNGVHPPQRCSQLHVLKQTRTTAALENGRVVGATCLHLQGDRGLDAFQVHTYFYGDQATPSYTRQQAAILARALGGRSTSGGMVLARVETSEAGFDEGLDAARGVLGALLSRVLAANSGESLAH